MSATSPARPSDWASKMAGMPTPSAVAAADKLKLKMREGPDDDSSTESAEAADSVEAVEGLLMTPPHGNGRLRKVCMWMCMCVCACVRACVGVCVCGGGSNRSARVKSWMGRLLSFPTHCAASWIDSLFVRPVPCLPRSQRDVKAVSKVPVMAQVQCPGSRLPWMVPRLRR